MTGEIRIDLLTDRHLPDDLLRAPPTQDRGQVTSPRGGYPTAEVAQIAEELENASDPHSAEAIREPSRR